MLAMAGTALLLVACESGGDKDVQEVNVSTKAIPGSSEDFKQNVKDRVFFALNKSKVTAAEGATIHAQAAWFKMYPQTTAMVEGHADERGSREYNLALGHRRADAVKKELAKHGVGADRLKTISYGKDKPPVQGTGEAAWQQQRTAITIVN
ncbi:MAG: OmpA family protein [Alphaproteobacteria bacterium]|nr:OmpA family protein [Alphaproteobacteria bacterium]